MTEFDRDIASVIMRIIDSSERYNKRDAAWLAEAVIIHEVLHTLGLPDRNDKDQDITEQVLRVCHR